MTFPKCKVTLRKETGPVSIYSLAVNIRRLPHFCALPRWLSSGTCTLNTLPPLHVYLYSQHAPTFARCAIQISLCAYTHVQRIAADMSTRNLEIEYMYVYTYTYIYIYVSVCVYAIYIHCMFFRVSRFFNSFS